MKNIDVHSMLLKSRKSVYIFLVGLMGISFVWFLYDVKIAFIQITFIIIVLVYMVILNRKVEKNLDFIIQEKEEKILEIKKDANFNGPIPYVVVDVQGNIEWFSDKFDNIIKVDKKLKNTNITKLIPEIKSDNLFDNISDEVFIEVEDSIYMLHKELVEVPINSKEKEFLMAIYFDDYSEYKELQGRYEDNKTVVLYSYIDNYVEVMNSIEEIRKPILDSMIERKLNTMAKDIDAVIKKIEKDYYVVVMSKKNLAKLVESKFSVLDEVRSINVGNDLPPTLSMGIGCIDGELTKISDYAKDAVELAIGRGGDQAIIKYESEYEYYGGKNRKDIENNNKSKARARIKAHAFKEIVKDVNRVIIMGHKNPDLDCLGAAVGMYRAVETLGKKAYIVLDEISMGVESLYERIIETEEFEPDYFIKVSEALDIIDEETLVVVVDVNQPTYVESKQLLDKAEKIVVIDHHIKSSDAIENADLTFLEAYASSTCELVTQLLQYISDELELKEIEADSLLAGIVVDTKNFIFKTGVKTFEAAAFLRRNGADNTRVKILFQNDFETYKIKAEAIEKAEIYKQKIAIAICPENINGHQVIISQIADELLNVTGIMASFVLWQKEEGNILVSARSLGDVNVEIIAEKMGGGGHFTASGAQIMDSTIDEVIDIVKNNITEYLEKDDEI